RGRFGNAGRTIILEEFLTGTECSLHVLVDGKSYILFPTAQDHKQLYDGNQGPNTGGMGAYSPCGTVDESQWEKIRQLIIEPTVRGLAFERIPFRGLLFPGIILTDQGPKVLEYNARFGDPETQVLLPRLKTDLVELLEATIDQRLDLIRAEWYSKAAVCVVLASAGYPGHYETGKRIVGLREAESISNVTVFHAGTRLEQDQVVTAGGRVLGVTAVYDNLLGGRRKAYDAVARIEFDNCYFRHDIAAG
ncbi:MAG: phosphoribosylamine--glycine ligase, partial [Verrucomicrobia bacterium]|nr:phosphoribosylamine--glycine ligase [Verrucomicrobiota bacterium]